jgi:hypothetical protein
LLYLANFGALKRTVHILLLSFYIFSCTELQELTKLPILFQHYLEHKNLDSSITFLTYLEHHYNDIPHTDNDEDRDNQLPFKTQESCTVNLINQTLPPSFEAFPKKAYLILTKQKILIDNDHIPHSAYTEKIWQPPKAVILS